MTNQTQTAPAGHAPDRDDAAQQRLVSFRHRAERRGVNPVVYWITRALVQPFFRVYFRLERIGMQHLPRTGALILAPNHRSFLDPFIVGTLVRRPVYFVAKKELFRRRWQAWLLNSLGAFPVDRGAGDEQAMATARRILERGDCGRHLPGGHACTARTAGGGQTRRGPPGRRDRRPGRAGGAHRHREHPPGLAHPAPQGARARRAPADASRPPREPSRRLAAAVTDRVWACVSLQWEWLGGTPAPRGQRSQDAAAAPAVRTAA